MITTEEIRALDLKVFPLTSLYHSQPVPSSKLKKVSHGQMELPELFGLVYFENDVAPLFPRVLATLMLNPLFWHIVSPSTYYVTDTITGPGQIMLSRQEPKPSRSSLIQLFLK